MISNQFLIFTRASDSKKMAINLSNVTGFVAEDPVALELVTGTTVSITETVAEVRAMLLDVQAVDMRLSDFGMGP